MTDEERFNEIDNAWISEYRDLCAEDVVKLLERYRAADLAEGKRLAKEWTKVEDGLPEDAREVEMLCTTGDKPAVWIGHFSSQWFVRFCAVPIKQDTVTHWRHIELS
jgi:hypothetical protein